MTFNCWQTLWTSDCFRPTIDFIRQINIAQHQATASNIQTARPTKSLVEITYGKAAISEIPRAMIGKGKPWYMRFWEFGNMCYQRFISPFFRQFYRFFFFHWHSTSYSSWYFTNFSTTVILSIAESFRTSEIWSCMWWLIWTRNWKIIGADQLMALWWSNHLVESWLDLMDVCCGQEGKRIVEAYGDKTDNFVTDNCGRRNSFPAPKLPN